MDNIPNTRATPVTVITSANVVNASGVSVLSVGYIGAFSNVTNITTAYGNNFTANTITNFYGSSDVNVTRVSGTTYTVQLNDWVVEATVPNTIITVPSNIPKGKSFHIKLANPTGPMTIQMSGSDTVDGSSNLVALRGYTSISMVSNGSSTWSIY